MSTSPPRFTRPAPGTDDDALAQRARTVVRGRAAWVFASPSAHGRLRRTGAAGTAGGGDADAGHDAATLAIRVAALAINGALPIVVPTADGAALAAFPVPFDDGRIGALVVACTRRAATRPTALEALLDLAHERAAHGTPPLTLALPPRR